MVRELTSVNVFLMWMVQEESRGLTYNISVFPQTNVEYNGTKSASLSLSYDIVYNISVIALCGENSSNPRFIELHYGK